MTNISTSLIFIGLVVVLAIGVLLFWGQGGSGNLQVKSTVATTISTSVPPTTVPVNKTNSTHMNSPILNLTQVQIVSVQPVYWKNKTLDTQSNTKFYFWVIFKNIGNKPIFLSPGCNYPPALDFSISPSSAVSQVPTGAGSCALGSAIRLAPGNSSTYAAPLFATLTMNAPGSITATFTLRWYSANASYSPGGSLSFANSTEYYMPFSRNFTFN